MAQAPFAHIPPVPDRCVIDRLLQWVQAVTRPLMWVGLVGGLLMMLHVTADVIARTVFNRPIAGTLEVASAYYMVAVAFLPWAWVAWREGHIRVEIFTQRLSPRRTAWLDAVVTLFTAAYVALFTWQTFARALQATRFGEAWEAPHGLLPVWPSRWVLPIAGAVMVAYLVLQAVADVLRLLRDGSGRAS